MADTTFSAGTVVASPWLNDVNTLTYRFTQAGTGSVARTGLSKLRETVSITDFGAVGDNSTDNYAAILAAQTALAAAGGGTLLIPPGTFRINTAIPRVDGVDYEGLGWHCILKPVGCGAFTYGYTTGFGQSRTANFSIEGSSGTTQIAIYQPGTLNNADELYGILIENMAIRGFNIAIKFRTIRNTTIRNNWIQDCNSGVHLIGQCLVVNIDNNKMIYAAGSGSGTQYGVYCDSFNYTSGTGIVRPETVRVRGGTVYGYTNGVAFTGVVNGIIDGATDIQATGVGVSWSAASAPIVIADSYIQIAGSSASIALNGGPQSSAIDTNIVIRGNHINAVNTTAATSVGIQLGNISNGNQDNVRIVDNSFFGFTKYDIAMYKSGHITVRGNSCYSTGVTASIFSTAMATSRPTYISENDCYSVITTDSADIASGLVQVGKNVINQTTIDYGNAGDSGWLTPTFAAGDYTGNVAMTWTVASGDVEVMRYRIVGKTMTVNMILSSTTVGGTPNSLLQIKVPDGRSASKRAINPCHILDNGTRAIAYLEINPSVDATKIIVNKVDASNWTASTDNTYVRGTLTFELV